MQRYLDALVVATLPMYTVMDGCRGLVACAKIALRELKRGNEGAEYLSKLGQMARGIVQARNMTPEQREEAVKAAQEHVESVLEAMRARGEAIKAAGADN